MESVFEVYRISKSKIIISIFKSFLLLIIIAIIFVFLYLFKDIVLDIGAYIGISIFGLIGCYPGLSALQEHYSNSQHKSMKFFFKSDSFSFVTDEKEMSYKIIDVKIITHYYTDVLFYTPWSQHAYFEFEMNNGERIKVSDLIISRKILQNYFPIELIVDKSILVTNIE
jgi:hypothetical protein